MQGQFDIAVQLAEMLGTDDSLFVARQNRIDTQSAVQTELQAEDSTRGIAVQRKALSSVFVPRDVLRGIQGTLIDHGIAIGYNDQESIDGGSRVDFHLREWPLEFVRWDRSREVLYTQVLGEPRADITHGDGRWTVFRKRHTRPWANDACLIPASFVWAAHANGLSSWVSGAKAHGLAQIMGSLPIDTPTLDENGNLTQEAEAFLRMMIDFVSGEAGAAIKPPGSTAEFVANGSNAWQVFSELLTNREKAAARIYLGTDAILGSVGGAPGVDISQLFGVTSTKIQGDFGAISAGLRTGVYEPWCAINEGTSRYCPSFKYLLPDPDQEAKRKEIDANWTRFIARIKAMREQGLLVSQAEVDTAAKDFGISPVPALSTKPATPSATPAG